MSGYKNFKKIFILIMTMFVVASNSYAFSWSDLWWRPDQQAAKLFKQQKYSQAAEQFNDPLWQGSASYRAANYQAAIDQFSEIDTVLAHYNRGNALAKTGKIQEAIDAYKAALAKDPNHVDALHNKKLLEQLLKQQEKNSGNQQSNSGQNSEKNNTNDKQNSSSTKNKQNNQSTKNSDPQQKKSDDKNQQTAANKESQSKSNSETPENKVPKNPKNIKPDSNGIQEQSHSAETRKREWQESTEQWLRRVPDDPGGLLRKKFIRDHLRQQGVE